VHGAAVAVPIVVHSTVPPQRAQQDESVDREHEGITPLPEPLLA
jgi:hypothetical protein